MAEESGSTSGLPPNLRPFVRTTRFRLLERMGEGGMGTVYRVHDRELRRDVALKVMRQSGPSALHALKREFRSRAGLSHPHLVQFHDLLVGDDYCCFSMELVEGRDFLGWVRPELNRARRVPVPPVPDEADAGLSARSPLPSKAAPRWCSSSAASRRFIRPGSSTATSSRPTCSCPRRAASSSSTSAWPRSC